MPRNRKNRSQSNKKKRRQSSGRRSSTASETSIHLRPFSGSTLQTVRETPPAQPPEVPASSQEEVFPSAPEVSVPDVPQNIRVSDASTFATASSQVVLSDDALYREVRFIVKTPKRDLADVRFLGKDFVDPSSNSLVGFQDMAFIDFISKLLVPQLDDELPMIVRASLNFCAYENKAKFSRPKSESTSTLVRMGSVGSFLNYINKSIHPEIFIEFDKASSVLLDDALDKADADFAALERKMLGDPPSTQPTQEHPSVLVEEASLSQCSGKVPVDCGVDSQSVHVPKVSSGSSRKSSGSHHGDSQENQSGTEKPPSHSQPQQSHSEKPASNSNCLAAPDHGNDPSDDGSSSSSDSDDSVSTKQSRGSTNKYHPRRSSLFGKGAKQVSRRHTVYSKEDDDAIPDPIHPLLTSLGKKQFDVGKFNKFMGGVTMETDNEEGVEILYSGLAQAVEYGSSSALELFPQLKLITRTMNFEKHLLNQKDHKHPYFSRAVDNYNIISRQIHHSLNNKAIVPASLTSAQLVLSRYKVKETNGFKLLMHLLKRFCSHLGAIPLSVSNVIAGLKVEIGDTLATFYARTMDTETRVTKSQQVVPLHDIFEQFLLGLMCTLALKVRLQELHSRFILHKTNHPLVEFDTSIHDIFDLLENSGFSADTPLTPCSSMSSSASTTMLSPPPSSSMDYCQVIEEEANMAHGLKKTSVITPKIGPRERCLICDMMHPTNQCHTLGPEFIPKELNERAARVKAANPDLKPNPDYVNKQFPPRRARVPSASVAELPQESSTEESLVLEQLASNATIVPEAAHTEIEDFVQNSHDPNVLETFAKKMDI